MAVSNMSGRENPAVPELYHECVLLIRETDDEGHTNNEAAN